MKAVRNVVRNFSVVGELLSSFGSKRWWLLPMLVSLFLWPR